MSASMSFGLKFVFSLCSLVLQMFSLTFLGREKDTIGFTPSVFIICLQSRVKRLQISFEVGPFEWYSVWRNKRSLLSGVVDCVLVGRWRTVAASEK